MVKLIVRLVLALALVGVVVNEGGQLLFAQTRASDIAHDAAAIGAETFSKSKNFNQAKADAIAEAQSRGARLRTFVLRPDGQATVKVVVRASTLIISRVSFLRHFGTRRATDTAPPPVL
jgi:hypothetical protein